jgi:uncharacterized membrane protein YbhN (UPF0104 family)
MNNFYYYLFYTIARFARRVNKRDKDFTFSSLIFLSLCVGLNILSIIFIVDRLTSVSLNIKVSILIMAAIVFGINYLLLMKNGKDVKIVEFYDNKYENRKHNFWNVFFVIGYVVFSYGICIYAAYLTKGN